MAIGDTGEDGLPALRHVAQEQDLAIEAATIHPLHVADIVAQDQAHTLNTVTHNVAQVIGDPGDPGDLGDPGELGDLGDHGDLIIQTQDCLPVASHVAQEQDLAQEAVRVLKLFAVGEAALDQALKLRKN